MKKVFCIFAAALLCCALLAGCGASAYGSANSTTAAAPSFETDKGAMDEMSADTATGAGTAFTDADVTLPQDNRKIIRDSTIAIEALHYDETVQSIKKALAEAKGYVSASSADGTAGMGYRYATYTCRVPAERYDAFMQALNGSGNVVRVEESTQDVTSAYVDTEARITSLQAQEERLYTLLEQAGSLENLIAIQQQLTEVQYQLESYTAQLRTYDTLTAYSTVTVSVEEVGTVTPPQEDTFIQRVGGAFSGMWNGVVNGAQGFVIVLIYAIPMLVVLGVIALVVLLCVRRSSQKKKAAPPVQSAPKTQEFK